MLIVTILDCFVLYRSKICDIAKHQTIISRIKIVSYQGKAPPPQISVMPSFIFTCQSEMSSVNSTEYIMNPTETICTVQE